MRQMQNLESPPMLLEPEFIGIDEAIRLSDLSRSEIYRRLSAGQLKAVRGGRKTLIVYESFKQMCKLMREEGEIRFSPSPRQRTQEETEEILRGL
jgi:hypothetical protein